MGTIDKVTIVILVYERAEYFQEAMYDLASDSKYDAPIANKLKWINIIHQLFRHERAAIEDFLQRPSYYKTIYERLIKNIWWKLWSLLYIRYTAIPRILRYFKR